MSTENKIILDIDYSINECLKYIKTKRPDIYAKLTSPPYRKDVEKTLSNTIYSLYHIDSKIAYYFKDIFGEEAKEQYYEEVKKLDANFVERLKQAKAIVEAHRDKFIINESMAWIQVNPNKPVKVTRRMYMNCDPEHINLIIYDLIKLMVYGFGAAGRPQIIFKFPNPDFAVTDMLIRADKIVVYYGKDPVTHEILRDWNGTIGKFLHKDIPLFTRKDRDGIGFAYEPPPEQQEYAKEHTGRTASFGTFMALVIARYFYSWCQTTRYIPNGSQIEKIAKEIYFSKIIEKHKYKFI